jgi:hypothetical protein
VQGAGYSESEVEKNTSGFELEMDTDASSHVVSQEILNQEWYATDQ